MNKNNSIVTGSTKKLPKLFNANDSKVSQKSKTEKKNPLINNNRNMGNFRVSYGSNPFAGGSMTQRNGIGRVGNSPRNLGRFSNNPSMGGPGPYFGYGFGNR